LIIKWLTKKNQLEVNQCLVKIQIDVGVVVSGVKILVIMKRENATASHIVAVKATVVDMVKKAASHASLVVVVASNLIVVTTIGVTNCFCSRDLTKSCA